MHLNDIKRRIKEKTFDFFEEFPDYRYPQRLAPVKQIAPGDSDAPISTPVRITYASTCNQVFDAFLSHCQMRVALNDMVFSTFTSYRRLLKANWRPTLGHQFFAQVSYTTLVTVANAQGWRTKKTYNNGISALRCAFEFGFKNFPDRKNPAEGLDTFRIKKKDLPPVDPFNVTEAEAIILGVHEEWGEAIGNFDEFRIFTGLRQSEQIALKTSDYDPRKVTLLVLRGEVMGVDRDRTKTSEDRIVELCPRARSATARK